MRLTVLGGCGAWPGAGQACSGYLLVSEGFRLLIDPGYATLPKLLEYVSADDVDAVLVSHGHPDHCADLNPLLRARMLREEPPPSLPLYTLPGALDQVLALDRPGMLTDGYQLRDFAAGDRWEIGPFSVATEPLPHSVPNAGMRLTAEGVTLVYTGDTGPSPVLTELAQGADLLLSDASFVDELTSEDTEYLLSASIAGGVAAQAQVGQLMLTHLMPGTDPQEALAAASRSFAGPVQVATAGVAVELT